jgi:transposase
MQTKVKQNYFEGQPVYVGIDYHSKNWKVNIIGEHYEHKAFSQDPDPMQLVRYLKKNFPGGEYHAVYEAGFSGFGACRKLRELGVDCMVIHPADVPTNQKERLQKTDKADCRKLARCLRNKEFKAIHIPDEELEADRALIRQRFRVMKDLSRTKNRIKSFLYQFGINIPERFTSYQTRHWSKVYIKWLEGLDMEQDSMRKVMESYLRNGKMIRAELLTLNRQVRALSQKSRYKNNYELLLTVPGVGLMTAMNLLLHVGSMNRFKTLDELNSYVGLIPSMHNSGDRIQSGKMINRGRKILKIMLIEAAWVAVRADPAMMAKFNELTLKMKKNKAIIRIARKLLSRIRYILQNQCAYETGVVE